MDSDTRIALIVAILLGIIGSSVIGCTYRTEYTLPIQMAEKGYCRLPVVGSASWAYQPCEKKQ